MRFPLVAAVALPALLLFAAAAWLSKEETRALTPEAEVNDLALQKAPPGIVIVGNSKSRSDVDAALLGKGLAYDEAIANVLVAGSSAPAWYAMLEQRVYANGHRPELVVVYGQLAALLRVEADSAGERKGLEHQLSGPSDVIDAKVLGRGAGPVGRLAAEARRNATAAHDALLAGVRDYAVGALLAPPDRGGLRAAGKALADPALEKTFGSGAHFLAGGGARVMPIAERASSHAMTASDVAPEDSLIPDLVAITKAHGARLLFVRAPLPMSSRYMDTLSPEVERGVFDLMNRLEVSYVDLQNIDLPADAWRDHMHLSKSGRGVVTNALAEAMVAARILDGGIAAARPVLLPTRVTRVGAPPPGPTPAFAPVPGRECAWSAELPDLDFLSDDTLMGAGFGRSSPLVLTDAAGELPAHSTARDLGATCAGAWQHRRAGATLAPRAATTEGLAMGFAAAPSVLDAKGRAVWWVYPGTSTEWHYDEPWANGPVRVRVTARAAKGGAGRLKVGGVEVPLVAHGRLLRAELALAAPPAPWTVAVVADADTWLVIDELVLGEQRLVGEPPVTLTPLVRAPTASADPPPVHAGAAGEEGGLPTLGVPGLSHIADDVLRARIDYPCSPLQLAAESAPDDWTVQAHALAITLAKAGRRGFGHYGDTLLLGRPSATMPAGPYRVRLDPKRRCGAARWLYPGDELRWQVVAATDRLRLGADRLVLEGIALLPEHDERDAAPLHVRVDGVRANAPPVMEADLDLPAQGGFTRVCLPFDTAFPPAIWMNLTLSSDDPDAWFIVSNVQLGESEHLPSQPGEGCDG